MTWKLKPLSPSDCKNIEKSRNDQPLKMEVKLKNGIHSFNTDTIIWNYLSVATLKSGFSPVKLSRSLNNVIAIIQRVIVPRFEVNWIKTQG